MKYQKEKRGGRSAARRYYVYMKHMHMETRQVRADVSRCNSPLSPSEGAVGFDFRYPKGIAGLACQDKKEKKKKQRWEQRREGGRNSETERERKQKGD